MEDLADKDNSPLKDSEISRLIGVSNNTGYKKQETIPARNLIDFKPKSLLEIAVKEENIHDNEGKKIEVQSKTNDIQNEIAEENEKSEAAEDSEDKTLELKEPEKVESPENQNLDEEYISKTTSQDLKNQNEEENKGEKTSSIGNLENVNGMKEPSEKNEEETKKTEVDQSTAARQEGIEIGKKMAITTAENNLTEASKTLHMVIESLKGKDVLDKTDLMNSILTTITNIAGERAGQVIDEHPESFKEKILGFIDDIDRSSKKAILNLNPHDAKLIRKSILEHFSENEIQIKENSDLFRGDAILQLGSIEIGDIISDRITFSSEIDNIHSKESEISPVATASSNIDNGNKDE